MVFRAFAAVIVAFALWSGMGVAVPEAQARYTCETENTPGCDEGIAYQQCMQAAAAADAYLASLNNGTGGGKVTIRCGRGNFAGLPLFQCVMTTYQDFPCKSADGKWFFYIDKLTCSKRATETVTTQAPSGSIGCIKGCEADFRDMGDGTSMHAPNGKVCDKKPDCLANGRALAWNEFLGVCQPKEPECPKGNSVVVGNSCQKEPPCPEGMALVNGVCKPKDNECPAGMIRSPTGQCIPGDGQCAKGEVRGPDGTCKRDKNNDGEPDPHGKDDPEEFSGGDTCNAPPACSGSPIMCGQARIQWRIDCNTRRNNNISGGHCGPAGMPVCTGEKCNMMEYNALLLQWRSTCSLEKMASGKDGTPGTGNGDANGNGVADVLEGRAQATPIGDGASDIASAKKWGIPLSTDKLDTSNMFGGGGSCPQPPSITIMGKTVSAGDVPYFCRIAAILRSLILIFGAYTAIRILMGAVF